MTTRSVVLSLFATVTLIAGVASAHGHHGGGELRAACGADIDKLCSEAGHGKATFECLKSHKADLSDTCKSFLDQHHHQHGEQPPAQ